MVSSLGGDDSHFSLDKGLTTYVLQVENVRMLDRYNTRKPSIGTLYLTATHLIFVDPDGKKETWVCTIGVTVTECVILLIIITEVSFIEHSLQIFTVVRKSELSP